MSNISFRKPFLINGINKICVTLISIIITGILSRILSPYDYGIVAVTTIFTNFFNLISGMGISPAIVQNKELDKDDYNSIFTFTLYFGLLLAFLFSILGYILVGIYKDDCYAKIGYLLGISVFFNTLNMVPNGIILKDKDFATIARRTITVNIVSGVLSILTAISGWAYYTLVFNSVFNALAVFIWNALKVQVKLTRKINWSSIKKIAYFSKYQMAFDAVNYFTGNLDNILISLYLGSTTLSYYDKAYHLMMYPVTIMGAIVSPVLQPVFSEYQNDKKVIYIKYLDILKMLWLVGILASFGFIACAEELIDIIYGKQWTISIAVFSILAISTFFRLGITTTGYIFQSVNKVKFMFKLTVVITLIYSILVWMGVLTGNLVYVAVFVDIAYFVQFLLTYISLGYILRKKRFEVLKEAAGYIFSFVFFAAFGYFISAINPFESIAVRLIIKAIVVLSVFMCYFFYTNKIRIIKAVFK